MTERPKPVKYLPALYIVGIVIASVAPMGGGNLDSITIFYWRADYVLHAFLFLPWAFLGFAAKAREPWWFIGGVLLAAVSEGVQYLLAYRAFNVNDLAANVLGVVMGYGVWYIVRCFATEICEV